MPSRRHPRRAASLAAACLFVLSTGTGAEQNNGATAAVEMRQDLKDAWLAGKIETVYALNRQLNSFDVDVHVDTGVVYLTGSVESQIERDLAGDLARSVEGVSEVRNELKVASAAALSGARHTEREALARERSELRRWVEDASITAVVKTKLLANQNTRALDVKVETRNRMVTLSGQVSSAEERQLAELLARNAENVAEVRNELRVDGTRAARMQ